MSKQSSDLMYSPVANKGGRYVGLSDGEWYYTAGWLVFPINGQMAIWSDGGQIGTNTALLRVPSKNLAIAFACNVHDIDRMPYIKGLYELVTGETMATFVTTTSKTDDALFKAMNETFSYGSLHFDKTRQPATLDLKELARAFAYFNKAADRVALQSNYEASAKEIADGRHPVGDLAFIKVGSYMATKLAEKHGNARNDVYRTFGATAFFDDYIKLYKSNRKHSKQLQFKKPFEQMVARWNQDWTRTWNEQTRKWTKASEAELVESGEQLKKAFTGAEVYPDLLDQLLRLRQGKGSAKAVKLAVELYPQSARANLLWGLFLILLSGPEIDKALVESTVPEKEPPVTYLKKSLEADPSGPASAVSLRNIARGWMNGGGTLDNTDTLLNIAIQLHPQSGILYEARGELRVKQQQNAQAVEAYQKALALEPNLQQAKEALNRLKP